MRPPQPAASLVFCISPCVPEQRVWQCMSELKQCIKFRAEVSLPWSCAKVVVTLCVVSLCSNYIKGLFMGLYAALEQMYMLALCCWLLSATLIFWSRVIELISYVGFGLVCFLFWFCYCLFSFFFSLTAISKAKLVYLFYWVFWIIFL